MSRILSADELEVCEQVGKGGFGVVYRGLVKATNEEVAIKQIDLENDQTDLFEINKEIQIISECRLPQITRFMGCFVKNYKLWVIMEFINGGSLFELLTPGPIQNETLVATIAKEILLALEYLHNQGKIHRDLKSQNILLSSSGEVKLTDFGVSAQLSSNFSRRNTTVGTPYWMAPEVILNNNGGHDSKADIWSLGCCLYELVNGKPPLQSQYPPMKALRYISRCVKDSDFGELIELDKLEVSDLFKDFLTKCFVIDPKQRFSAKNLLKHKFITKNQPSQAEKEKLIKSLITSKHLWDQENHVLKTQKFYLPTEIVNNRRKWNEEPEDDEDTIKFDISTIDSNESLITTRESSVSPTSTLNTAVGSDSSAVMKSSEGPTHIEPKRVPEQTAKQKNLTKTIQPEMNRILNKVFHKLETRSNLSTDQYDSLVNLNGLFLNLITFASYDPKNSSSNNKILICQFLKYFLKELNKSDDTPLKKMVIPSELADPGTAKYRSIWNRSGKPDRPGNPFDEIETTLFETWIDEMKHN